MAPSTTPHRARRAILALAFLYLAWLGWSRAQQAVLSWDLLVELGARPGPLYLIFTGAGWGVLGLVAAALALLRVPRAWAGRSVLVAALLFAASYWADFLLFTRAPEMMVNWPFALRVTVVGLGLCVLFTVSSQTASK